MGNYKDSAGTYYGFLQHQGRYTTIDGPKGVKSTRAYGINAQGDIVGVYFDSTSTPHGFLLRHG